MENQDLRWNEITNSFDTWNQMTFTKEKNKIISYVCNGNVLGTFRRAHLNDMQEYICPEGEDVYNSQEERNIKKKELEKKTFNYRLPADSEQQLKYNSVINSILDYKDYDEYKYKTSLKYKVLKFLKLIK
jgi:hypothetical protein